MSDKLKNFLVRTASGAVMLAVVLGAATRIYTYALLLLLITVVGMWCVGNFAFTHKFVGNNDGKLSKWKSRSVNEVPFTTNF